MPTRIVGDVFLFVAPDRGPLFEPSVHQAELSMGPYFHERFERPPKRAVTVLIYSTPAAFDAGCRERLGELCPGRFGLYWPLGRTIFVNAFLGVFTVNHEIVHPIMQSDFALAPKWFCEGIGTQYERPVFDGDGGVHGRTNFRLDRLKQALASPTERTMVRAEAIFAMSDDDLRGGPLVLLRYAIVRFFCQWLDEQGLLWPFYRAWKAAVGEDPTGDKTFQRIVGAAPVDVNERWIDWIGRQRFVPGG